MPSDVHDRRDVYAACVDAAVDLGVLATRHLLKRAGDTMLQRAATIPAEDGRQWQVEAAHSLARHQDAYRQAFRAALRQEFATVRGHAATNVKTVKFEALELMGEEQVEATVELLRAEQALLAEAAEPLTQLDALVSAVRGSEVVDTALNPLRPDAWVRALRHAALQCGVPAWMRVRWLQHLSQGLAPELASIYRQLAVLLHQHGVSAATFALNVAPVTGTAAHLPVAAVVPAAPSRAAPAPAPSVPVLNLRALRRLLAGDGTAGGGPPATATRAADASSTLGPGSETLAGAMTVPYAFDALQEMKQLDEALQRVRDRHSAAHRQGEAAVNGAPSAAAWTPAQVLSQEVVKLMVDNIAGDDRLLADMQRAVRDLEPALLRLACNDPRFFRDKEHPARLFLTEITERSLAWTAVGMPGRAEFLEPLRQAVDALADLPMNDAEPFRFALKSLEEAWSDQEQRSWRARANAARTLIKAEQRNLIAQRIADSLKQRTDIAGVSTEVRRFLTGPWSHVMAAAEMAESTVSADPGGYGAVIDDLVWSARPRLAAENRIRLARLVPPMLAALRRGLASIEYPADSTQRFLDHLADVHQAALRPQVSGPAPLEAARSGAACANQQDEPQVWLEPSEALQSGLMAFFPEAASPTQVPAPHAQETDRRPAGMAERLRGVERLQPGVWVDLYIDSIWSRWRVAWASPHALLFMFSDGGGKYKSMTRSVLDTMMALGALRIVAEQTLLAGALDAVAERALRNSMDSVR